MLQLSELQLQQEGAFTFSNQPMSDLTSDAGILKEIQEYDKSVVSLALGDFGLRLQNLAKSIDLSHPDTTSLPVFNDGWSQKLCQLLQLVHYAKENKLSTLLNDFYKFQTALLPSEFQNIDAPTNNQRFVRLIPERTQREAIRKTKSKCNISLKSFCEKGRMAWDGLPNDFSMYVRHNDVCHHEIKKAEKKAKRFRQLGCNELYSHIKDSIVQFKATMEDNYYGFHRMTLIDSAVILAKMHGFTFTGESSPPKNSVIIDANLFKDYVFDDNLDRTFYYYAPRAYSLDKMKSVMPKSVKKVVEELENFKAAGGKAIFDHYVVVVPSIGHPDYEGDFYPVKLSSGRVKNYKKKSAAQRNIDITLVKKDVFVPVLLGEKDKKCFFICYWI